MSDDRFKQARRSLIDRNKQRQQDDQSAQDDDDFGEGEKTLMVNVDELDGNASQPSSPAGPPSAAPTAKHDAVPDGDAAFGGDFGDADGDAATQMIDVNDLDGGPDESTAPSHNALSVGGNQSVGGAHAAPTDHKSTASKPPSGQQVFSTGDASSGHQGATDFVNIDEFTDASPGLTPDDGSAGYEGETAFVRVDDLQGAPQHQRGGPDDIANDPMLSQSYNYGPESIQRGAVTLVFGQNQLGNHVVLRRVWAGNTDQMSAQIRQRIGQLDELHHPQLTKLNGVVATKTGLWAEMVKPDGYRLSAVLQQHGPQAKANVIDWLTQIAGVLDAVHASGLVYANLTPDAVWIQDDNSVIVEPFDLLSFDDRADLGSFGAPELKHPPENQQLSPATDVYSLAAVGAAALTGMPLQPDKLADHDDQKLAQQVVQALAQDPADRPQRASDFAAQLGSNGLSLGGFNLDPSEIDIKIVAALAAVLLVGLGGYMYWDQQQAKAAAAAAAAAQNASARPDSATNAAAAAAGAPAQDQPAPAADGADTPSVAPPGPLTPDPRLTVSTSFQTNPPEKASDDSNTPADQQAPTGDDAVVEANRKRESAKQHMQHAGDLALREDRIDEYTAALKDMTRAIEIQDNQPSAADRAILDQLHDQEEVSTLIDDLHKQVAQAVDSGDISAANRPYQRLTQIDYHANSADFFRHANTVTARTIHTPAPSPEENDDDSD